MLLLYFATMRLYAGFYTCTQHSRTVIYVHNFIKVQRLWCEVANNETLHHWDSFWGHWLDCRCNGKDDAGLNYDWGISYMGYLLKEKGQPRCVTGMSLPHKPRRQRHAGSTCMQGSFWESVKSTNCLLGVCQSLVSTGHHHLLSNCAFSILKWPIIPWSRSDQTSLSPYETNYVWLLLLNPLLALPR